MPENKNQNINLNISNTEEITASSSGTSSEEIKIKINENVFTSFCEKLAKYWAKELAENPQIHSSEHLEFKSEKDRKKWEYFHWVRYFTFSEATKRETKSNKIAFKRILTDEEIEFGNELQYKLGLELEIYEDNESEEKEEAEGIASTSEGKEVIKAEISQELTKAKGIFENFKLGEISQEEIQKKIERKWEKLYQRRIYIAIPVAKGVFGGGGNACWAPKEWDAYKTVITEQTNLVKKLVNNSIADLENQRNKIVKKVDKLIEARNQEVIEAREIIKALETVNQEAKNKNADLRIKNKDLKEKSDEEIKRLQEDIKKLNAQLADYQTRRERVEKAAKSKIHENIQKPTIKAVMKNNDERIVELEKELEEVRLAAKILDESLGHERLQLQHEKESHELTKKNAENETKRKESEITRKENELERERKIFLDRTNELNGKIKGLEKKITDLEQERDEIEEELNELKNKTVKNLQADKETLKSKIADLKQEKERESQEKEEWGKKYEALTKKSWFYQACDKVGLVSLKNSIANASAVAGFVVVLYAISWMWKNLVKPTYRNFKGDDDKTSKPKSEPTATPAAPTNQNQPPIIIIPPQHQAPPTLPPQPQEIKAIEIEPPKPIAKKIKEISPNLEKFSAVRPDEQEPEQENFPSTPQKNSKKGKATKKKAKNKN